MDIQIVSVMIDNLKQKKRGSLACLLFLALDDVEEEGCYFSAQIPTHLPVWKTVLASNTVLGRRKERDSKKLETFKGKVCGEMILSSNQIFFLFHLYFSFTLNFSSHVF